jgi:multidrug efflux system membrane fusion protein
MLSYTKITAPFDGRTGLRLIDEGNLVQANDATGVVVITQIQPISVIFNLPQQQYQQVSKAFAQGTLPVDAVAADGKTVLDRGTLQVIDNQMDQTTGTIRMKAEFPNTQLQLWPGQFVNVRVLVETLRQVVVVPVSAVQRGPNGTFVYALDAESKVAVRAVKVGQQDDTSAVIPEGLKPDERVVTTGFTRLSNGTRVRVQAGEGEAGASDTPPAPSPAPSERRRKRDGGAGAENTDGKERRRSENTASPPSTRQ